MMDFLNAFKSLVKLGQIRTDNNVFRLHYKITVIMLIVFSLLLTSKQYFGEPIQCLPEAKLEYRNIIETYCWIFGTYTLKSTLKDPSKIPGAGPDPHRVAPWDNKPQLADNVIWHKYYQWVCIVFCFQALLFYMPRYLWKTWEGGQLRGLVSDYNGPAVNSNWNNVTKCQMINSFINSRNMHNLYASRYTFCEILNMVNVICQFFFLNWLLNGQFLGYGLKVILSLNENEPNQMLQVFPKATKCQFYKFGGSGTLENRDALCLLPLNVLNEKLFLILWFWFICLGNVTLIALVYRVFVIVFPTLRVYLLMAQARCLSKKQASLIVSKFSYGDFFLLYHIGKNANQIVFRDFVLGMQERLKTKTATCPYYPSFETHSI